MAPKGSGKGAVGNGNGGRIKFRFVDIEMENVNESITEGLKSLAAALSRGPQQTPLRTLPKVVTQTLGTGLTEPPEIDEEPFDSEDIEGEVQETDPEPIVGASTAGKPRKLREPQFLRDLDLTTASTSLEDYMTQKNPTSTTDKYLVIAQWFKEFMATPEFTVDHIFTAYDTLGWRAQMPHDAGQPLRALKRANMLDSGAARGSYQVNWKGSKAVAAMPATA